MGGKASILLVLGFSTIFLVVGYRFSSLSTTSVDNQVDYYKETTAHNLAVSGAQIAANHLFIDNNWSSGYSNLPFEGGFINISVQDVGDMKEFTSEGIFHDASSEVIVLIKESDFSKYGNFYQTLGALPATGDTFRGPFHTQDNLTTWGSPVFDGKASTAGGVVILGPSTPEFNGGIEEGVDQPLDFDTSGMRMKASSNGLVLKDTLNLNRTIDVNLTFNSNGTVSSNFSIDDGLNIWSPVVTVPLTTMSPNGIIYIEAGNINVKGTIKGRASIVASSKGNPARGNVFQTDDLQYSEDPRINPNSNDMLGVIAENNIRLQYNDDTKHGDIITMASMFARNGNIGPDNALLTNDHNLANWKILGGLIANSMRVSAHYDPFTGQPYEGYRLVHDYDERFLIVAPPSFPPTGTREIVSWYE